MFVRVTVIACAALALFGANVIKAETAAVAATEAEVEAESVRTLMRKMNMTRMEFDDMISQDRADVAACSERTTGYLFATDRAATYADDTFFDCFRPVNEVFAFLDRLVSENSKYFSKINRVSSTVEGADIPAYRISTGSGKKVLYIQGLIHAREWIAGSSVFFTIASLLDALQAGKSDVTSILDNFDFVFTPVLNIDGYKYTWSGSRYWRKNRRGGYGVDLNRNFPPQEWFNKDGNKNTGSETYPGEKPLSEPESAGIWNYLKTLNLGGVIDVHSYGALVLRPYGNQDKEPAEPYKTKLRNMGDGMRDAIYGTGRPRYTSQTGADLYVAYGCFDDGMYIENQNRVPVFTIEVEGNSFVASQSSIRPVGRGIYAGLLEFARQAANY